MSAPGRSRAAAVALLVGVVAVGGAALIVPAALYWTENGEIIRAERSKVLRAEERRESREMLLATGDAWNAYSRDPSSGFSMAQTDEIAAANTRARIEGAFSRQGGAARSVKVEVNPAGRVGVRKLALDVRGSVPRPKLAALLGALESEPPFLIVEQFDASLESGDVLSLQFSGGVYRLEGAGL